MPSVFYRSVSAAERDDIHVVRRLRAHPGGGMEGKHVTTSAEFARKFGEAFVEIGWQTEAHVVRITFSDEVAVWDGHGDPPAGACVALYDPEADSIGPGYFANDEALQYATVEVLEEIDP